MPQSRSKSGPAQGPLQLLYRNGAPSASGQLAVPRFSDVCLTKESNDQCDYLINEARNFEGPIRNENQLKEYIEFHSLVDEIRGKIRELVKNDREPFVRILQQIQNAIQSVQNKLDIVSEQLNRRIVQWRNTVLEGQRREQARLQEAAEEKKAQAKYTEDPRKKRQAALEAKQLEEAAKSAAPKPAKGIDTEEYWEGQIVNRVAAAKLPAEIVVMDVDQTQLNQRIKALKRAGEKITPNILPGLNLERKTRVRYHR